MCGLQRIGDFLDLGGDLLAFLRRGKVAFEIRVKTEEPRMRLIIRTERVMADAIGADASCDEAGHIGDGCAFQKPLSQTTRLILVGWIAAAASAFAGSR